jgi:hypothetical protein
LHHQLRAGLLEHPERRVSGEHLVRELGECLPLADGDEFEAVTAFVWVVHSRVNHTDLCPLTVEHVLSVLPDGYGVVTGVVSAGTYSSGRREPSTV